VRECVSAEGRPVRCVVPPPTLTHLPACLPHSRTPHSRTPLPSRRHRLFLHELAALLGIAGPLVVSQLGGIAMNTTDTIMLARLGSTALAAAGLATAVQMAITVTCNGVVMGMIPLVSRAFGAGDRVECRRVLVQGLWLALALSVPTTALSLSGRWVALLLGQDAQVADVCGRYLQALAPGVESAQ